MSTDPNSLPSDPEQIVARVRESYGHIATTRSSCCGPELMAGSGAATTTGCGSGGKLGYAPEDLAAIPEDANLGLGCGAPPSLLAAQPGETILDLGSGPGLDAFLAARAVGVEGKVIGIDMTPEMIQRASRTAERAGYANVEFRLGRLEALPVDDGSVDAVISNCVINLVPDKGAVFREAARVLKPGGRLVISDVVLDAPLPEALMQHLPAWAGCVSGAVVKEEYFAMLNAAGLGEIEVLQDRDALALFAEDLTEIGQGLAAAGVTADSLRGRVRSITYRARKR